MCTRYLIINRVSELKVHIELTRFVQPEKIEIDANERAVNEKSQYCFFVCTTFDSFLNDLPNILPFTSIPLPQIATSNPRLQPDTDFTVDMFPYKKTELFRCRGLHPNFRKSPEIRRFLALDFISLGSFYLFCITGSPVNGSIYSFSVIWSYSKSSFN